ncbi:MAG: hypothetical protein HY615_12175 [Candidatus Rokubacteria bacterium]|nr:hypothetical protein [Candidatus Rokubacteria bacterium]
MVSLALLLLLPSSALAEPLSVKAVMSPKEQIHVDLPTPQKHFVLFVRREGKATGVGLLDGAQLTEYGMHDIRPGIDGSPRGYLVARLPGGDQAVIQWEVQATFIPGPDGKPRLLDNGVWRLIGGTGTAESAKGAGILHIRAVSQTDREFSLEGEVVSSARK